MLSLLVAVLAADAPSLKVGAPAPSVIALFADGNPYDAASVKGKFVLMSWWSADDATTKRHFAALRNLRKEFLGEKRLQMISIKLGGEWGEWLELQDKQPPHDPKLPLQPFYSDSKWWQAFHAPTTDADRNPFRVSRAPASFLIGPDGKLLAVNLSDAKLRETVKSALSRN